MSFQSVELRPVRINRSELAVPANRPRFIEKSAQSSADVVFLDLEDSVPRDGKNRARQTAIEAINDIDWRGHTLSLRINGLDTPFMYRDVIDVLEQTGDRLDLLMIPKVGTASDVYALDMLVTQIEMATGRKKRLGFELIIETALGMRNIHAIAFASARIEALHFGVADYSASVRARTTRIGGPIPGYAVMTDRVDGDGNRYHWNDPWHYPLSRLVIAARAAGLRPVDGPFGDYPDLEGYASAARCASVLGCEGKWAIHPSQIDVANEVFAPTQEEIQEALDIVAAMEEAEASGDAAVTFNGRLVDTASIRQAQSVVAYADAIGAVQGGTRHGRK